MNLRLIALLVVGLLATAAIAIPTPQEDTVDAIVVDEGLVEENGDYGDFIDGRDGAGDSDGGSPLGGIGGILQGVFGIFHNTVSGIGKLAGDKRVQNAVGIGMNATGNLLKTGTQFIEAAPRAGVRTGNLLGGLLRVANESTSSFESRINDLDRFAKLFSTFLRSYQGIVVDGIEDFGETFNRRLRCHTECDTLEGEKKEECEEKFCKYFNPEEFSFDDPEPPKDPDYDIEVDF